MAPKSSKEKQEIKFSAAETYNICKLYQEEDVPWNQNLADYSKSEKREAALQGVKEKLEEEFPAIAINNIHTETTMSSSSMMKLSPGIKAGKKNIV